MNPSDEEIELAQKVCQALCATFPHARVEVSHSDGGFFLIQAIVFSRDEGGNPNAYALVVNTKPESPFLVCRYDQMQRHITTNLTGNLTWRKGKSPLLFRGVNSLQVWLDILRNEWEPFKSPEREYAPHDKLPSYEKCPLLAYMLMRPQLWIANPTPGGGPKAIQFRDTGVSGVSMLTVTSPTSANIYMGTEVAEVQATNIRPGDPAGITYITILGNPTSQPQEANILAGYIEKVARHIIGPENVARLLNRPETSPFW